MKEELIKIRNKYIKPTTQYWYYDDKVAKFLLEVINKATPHDCPDFYYIKDGICYICEYFQFDASKNTRKGSSLKRAEKDSERKINEQTKIVLEKIQYNKHSITDCGAFFENVECVQNKHYWKDNFIKIFNDHYVNIINYKKNLLHNKIINKNTKVKNIFIIEDTTELGAFINKNAECVCYPICFDFGIDTLKKATEIDYVIFLNSAIREMILIDRNIFKNMQSKLDFDQCEMFFFNKMVNIVAMVVVPDKLLKKDKQ